MKKIFHSLVAFCCILFALSSCKKDKEEIEIPSPEQYFIQAWNIPDDADGTFLISESCSYSGNQVNRSNGYIAWFDTLKAPGDVKVYDTKMDTWKPGVRFYQIIGHNITAGDSVVWNVETNPNTGIDAFTLIDTFRLPQFALANIPDSVDYNADLILDITTPFEGEITYAISSSNGTISKLAVTQTNTLVFTSAEIKKYVGEANSFSVKISIRKTLGVDMQNGKKYYLARSTAHNFTLHRQ